MRGSTENHPEVAILGLHRIGPPPLVGEGEIVVLFSCTSVHRVVAGVRANEFLLSVIARLEAPAWTGASSDN
jgi:pyruvate/2-oxoglutarate dehydrogenase complex dihydrolipoamide acyltransferase (E2) component